MPGSNAALAAAAVVGAFAAFAAMRVVVVGGAGGWRSSSVGYRAGGRLHVRNTSRRWQGASRVATWVFIALVATALVHLALLLITGDFSVRYVWQHSASYEEALRRLSALLAGSEGSLLVWAVLAAAVAGWTARRRADDPAGVRHERAIVHLIVVAVALGVLLLAIASTPFQSFADAFPSSGVEASPAEGRGLNPVLANPWMPAHTVLTLSAYAVIGLAFAIAVVQLLRVSQGRVADAQEWRLPGMQAARWAWLLLSVALLTGVLWAYEEMTFGWFWSWDPVESATLAVWLLLTAALHAGGEGGEGRRGVVYGPLMLALAFVGVVFASFVTRSGLHPSVHAFAGGSAGPYLGVGLAVLVAAVATLAWAAARRVPPSPSRRPWLFWAVWPLLIGAGLIVWGLAYPMAVTLFGGSVDLDTGFFTTWGYLLALVLLLVMGFGMQAARTGRRDAVPMLVLFGTLTALAAVVKPVPGLELMSVERRAVVGGWEAFLGSASVLSVLPAAAYALLAVAERWWSRLREVGGGNRLRDTGSAMIHAGVVAAVLGATLATVLSSSVTVGVSPATGVGVAEGITVRVVDVDVSRHFDGAGALVEERETATLEVSTGGRIIAVGTATVGTFPERAMGRHAGVLVSRGPVGDVQAIYHGVADLRPDGIPVTVRRIPLVGLLWLGMVMIIGGTALMTTVRGPGPAGRAAAQATAPKLVGVAGGGGS